MNLKPIEGDYLISDTGKVFNGKTGRELKLDNLQRYSRIALVYNGRKNRLLIHRLVAQAFIDNPENKPYVNHIDGNVYNNTVENLEWVTQEENVKHAIETNLWDNRTTTKVRETSKNTCTINNKLKKKVQDLSTINMIRTRLIEGELIKTLAEEYKVSIDTISAIKNKKGAYSES